jgi:hypothetical protein
MRQLTGTPLQRNTRPDFLVQFRRPSERDNKCRYSAEQEHEQHLVQLDSLE